MDAVVRATRSDPAIFAIVVDAKDEAAVAFYQHLGFRRFTSRPMSLFLPVSAALEAIGRKGLTPALRRKGPTREAESRSMERLIYT